MIKINDQVIGNNCYPNNERILKINKISDFTIELKYMTDIDISILSMLKRHISDKYNNPDVTLIMKYVPYSRMDRNMSGYIFSLKYFCQTINELNFKEVVILDPHSNVTSALLNRCKEIDISGYINSVFKKEKIDYVFYPDAGACKRYGEILKLPNDVPYFYGDKKRNLSTGEITNYELVSCPDIKNKNILILDDLCAKGYTFLNASKKLKEFGANDISLYVSHCENSIYNGELLKSGLLKSIFTTDSILDNWSCNFIYDVEKI